MPRQFIEDLDDVRLEPYRNLRNRNLTFLSGRFVVESRLLVARLVTSDHEIESLVVDEAKLEALPKNLSDSVNVWVIPSKRISDLIGFDFHRGVLGCGRRKPRIEAATRIARGFDSNWTGVMMVGVQDPENMGLIARTCAALDIDDLFIGPSCVDPYARRVLRVSMGGMLKLSQWTVSDATTILSQLSAVGVQTIATTLAADSVRLEEFRRRGPVLIVLGNEAEGLSMDVQEACETRLRIDMSPDTDSLNVSIAAGIVLHYATRLA